MVAIDVGEGPRGALSGGRRVAASGRTRVLGVDPGTLRTGYGIIDVGAGGAIFYVACGLLQAKGDSHVDRINLLCRDLSELIEEFGPDAMALELAYGGRNTASALKLAETFDDGALAGWTRSSEAKYTGARRATRRSREKTPIAMDERLRRDSMAEKTRDDARTIGTRARGRTRGRGKTRGGAGEGRAGVEARAEGREGDARGETEIRDRASASDGDGTGIDDGGTTAVDGTKRASRCVTDSNDRWFRAM